MIQKTLASLALILGVSVLYSPPLVVAGPFDGSRSEACDGVGGCAAGQGEDKATIVINNIVNLLTVIIGIVAVVMIIINGFRFITSGGDANTVASARNGLLYAIVGLVIVALAQIIVRFVLTKT